MSSVLQLPPSLPQSPSSKLHPNNIENMHIITDSNHKRPFWPGNSRQSGLTSVSYPRC